MVMLFGSPACGDIILLALMMPQIPTNGHFYLLRWCVRGFLAASRNQIWTRETLLIGAGRWWRNKRNDNVPINLRSTVGALLLVHLTSRWKFILIIFHNAKNNTSRRLNLPFEALFPFFSAPEGEENQKVMFGWWGLVWLLRFFPIKSRAISANRHSADGAGWGLHAASLLLFDLSASNFLIQISRGASQTKCTREEEPTRRRKNNEKRHNYMHA